jgi:hypothetical protein
MSRALWLIGNRHDRRTGHWRRAFAEAGLPQPGLIDYREVLAGDDALARIGEGDLVRLESPGEDLALERALLSHGYASACAEGRAAIHSERLAAGPLEPGLILSPRQWYCGFARLLTDIEQHLTARGARWLTPPQDVRLLFDKGRCQRRLAAAGVLVPELLGEPQGFEDLCRLVREQGVTRLFLKPAHGSSASGVVALRLNGDRWHATTTAHLVQSGAGARLYNSLRLCRYRNQGEIATLVDLVCAERAHAERWLPKAVVGECEFDLRVLLLKGRAAQVVIRTSRGPFTNLHLGNGRGDLVALRERMGPQRWRRAMDTAEAVASVFPDSVQLGVDLALAPGFRAPVVLEVNAFGDLLPGVLWRGHDSYRSQVELLRGNLAPPEAAVA